MNWVAAAFLGWVTICGFLVFYEPHVGFVEEEQIPLYRDCSPECDPPEWTPPRGNPRPVPAPAPALIIGVGFIYLAWRNRRG